MQVTRDTASSSEIIYSRRLDRYYTLNLYVCRIRTQAIWILIGWNALCNACMPNSTETSRCSQRARVHKSARSARHATPLPVQIRTNRKEVHRRSPTGYCCGPCETRKIRNRHEQNRTKVSRPKPFMSDWIKILINHQNRWIDLRREAPPWHLQWIDHLRGCSEITLTYACVQGTEKKTSQFVLIKQGQSNQQWGK